MGGPAVARARRIPRAFTWPTPAPAWLALDHTRRRALFARAARGDLDALVSLYRDYYKLRLPDVERRHGLTEAMDAVARTARP